MQVSGDFNKSLGPPPAYDDKVQEEKNIECVPGQYFIQGGNDSEEKKACQFKRSLLQNCSGIEDPTFGYSKGQPCILLKMNRVQRKLLVSIPSFRASQCDEDHIGTETPPLLRPREKRN